MIKLGFFSMSRQQSVNWCMGKTHFTSTFPKIRKTRMRKSKLEVMYMVFLDFKDFIILVSKKNYRAERFLEKKYRICGRTSQLFCLSTRLILFSLEILTENLKEKVHSLARAFSVYVRSSLMRLLPVSKNKKCIVGNTVSIRE